MNDIYRSRVELLLRIVPIITAEECFAIHGGTAINLFVKELPRYSVDIDLTYIPVENGSTSLANISRHLQHIADGITKAVKGVRIDPRWDTSKLLCDYRGSKVKIEVNQIKRGIVCGPTVRKPLCQRAQDEFRLYCEADIVPMPQLYGGKVAAALSRQHPRDMFDVRYMELGLDDIKEGLIFCLLSSDRPIYESFSPREIDQRDAMKNQFAGMSDVEFSYEEYETTRSKLIREVNKVMTSSDRRFLVDFEKGEPNWKASEYASFEKYPSVQWKQINIGQLRQTNPSKLADEVERLMRVLAVD
ncbi:MAG: nucleotidyl transferase AbiEii/AbiGii toxin family protein [Tidjanibacter sp.]|nr:nucleotidyl transferase AbiEii/AbiGii toxin family protein [Tidjanibacter sp.]